MVETFNEDYFLRGKQAGLSLYEDYRWLPDLTIPMVQRFIEYLGIDKKDTILDYGCARGYVVRAFRELGYQAEGIDVSHWAIENCDQSVREHVSVGCVPSQPSDWVIAKDVLEHIDQRDLRHLGPPLFASARKGFFVIVPLSPAPNEPYVVPEYERDVTHCVRLDLGSWLQLIRQLTLDEFDVLGTYRVKGIKSNYEQWEQGNAFILGLRPGFSWGRGR